MLWTPGQIFSFCDCSLPDINGTIATQFKICFSGRKFVISFYVKLEEIEGDGKILRRWALNVVIGFYKAYYYAFTLKSFSGRTDVEIGVLEINIYPIFLTLAPSLLMQTDACKIDVILDVSVFTLCSTLYSRDFWRHTLTRDIFNHMNVAKPCQ